MLLRLSIQSLEDHKRECRCLLLSSSFPIRQVDWELCANYSLNEWSSSPLWRARRRHDGMFGENERKSLKNTYRHNGLIPTVFDFYTRWDTHPDRGPTPYSDDIAVVNDSLRKNARLPLWQLSGECWFTGARFFQWKWDLWCDFSLFMFSRRQKLCVLELLLACRWNNKLWSDFEGYFEMRNMIFSRSRMFSNFDAVSRRLLDDRGERVEMLVL